MPEVAWARPVGSGCRVFRARNRVVYVFRVATAVASLDVEQPGPELDLAIVEEVAEMVYQRLRIHLGAQVTLGASALLGLSQQSMAL